MKIKLLDTTLRDGGYKNNFNFPLNTIETLIKGLDEAGIDYIEIGYRNGSLKPIQGIGPTGLCRSDYIELCRNFIKNAKLAVMFHPKNICLDEIDELAKLGVDTVRICFIMQTQETILKAIDKAKEKNLEVCVNIIKVSQYTYEDILQLINKFIKHEADVIYFADSNGSLNPQQVRSLFSKLTKKYSVKFGFHAHDNLFLAQANAIAAIENGVNLIDTSVLGLGRGVGNLRTEGFISFLLSRGIEQYNLCKIFEVTSYLKNQVFENCQTLSPQDIILGLFNLSRDDASKLGELKIISDYYSHIKQHRYEIFKGLI